MYLHRVVRTLFGEVRDVARGASTTHRRLRERLVALAVATIGMDLVCALLALLLERHGPKTEITSFGDALFWTSTQLLTVSSSIQNPVTTGGRILDVVMEAYAIVVVGTLAGAFGAFLIRRGEELEDRPGPHA
jgi:hypothetical protein